MSQYPPSGPPGVPPGYPPQGFGPQGYSLPAMTKTSGAAVCSLVCGLVMCIPGITGLVAVITGIIGIAETGKPAVRGRGMAIAGLVLGIISLGLWGAVGVGVYQVVRASGPQRIFAKSFVNDLDAGRIDACAANSTAKLSRDQIDAASKKMQAWGTLRDIRVFVLDFNPNSANFAGSATGICNFGGIQHTFTMMLVKDSSGQLKVDSFLWQN
jgi:hypothetical protein